MDVHLEFFLLLVAFLIARLQTSHEDGSHGDDSKATKALHGSAFSVCLHFVFNSFPFRIKVFHVSSFLSVPCLFIFACYHFSCGMCVHEFSAAHGRDTTGTTAHSSRTRNLNTPTSGSESGPNLQNFFSKIMEPTLVVWKTLGKRHVTN